MSERNCDGCGIEGVVTADMDAISREDGLVWLMAGRTDGSDLYRTYCEDCALELFDPNNAET